MSASDIDDTFNAPPPAPSVAPSREDILNSLRWGKTQEVQTKKGPRLRTTATATPACHDLFARERSDLWSLGYSLQEWPPAAGKWSVTRWEMVPEKIIVQRQEAKAASRATDADINVPAPEGCAYLGYQRAGIAYAFERPATLFADEMGLGKSVEAIGVMNAQPELQRILIICPASLKLNWKRELEKWLVKPRTIFIADSKVCPAINGIVIINYDVLAKHEDVIKGTEWDLLVADEAHYLKNPKAQRSRMVVGCRATKAEKAAGMADIPGIDAKKRLLLTGTPIANRPIELYPLIHYLDPITWSSFWKYAARYTGASQENGWDTSGAANLDELQDKLRSTCLPYGTIIETEHGPRQIGELVASETKCRVRCADSSTGDLRWGQIVAHTKRAAPDSLIRIRHQAGELFCTGDHKVWTEDGYIRADQITRGVSLRILRPSKNNSRSRDANERTLLLNQMRGHASGDSGNCTDKGKQCKIEQPHRPRSQDVSPVRESIQQNCGGGGWTDTPMPKAASQGQMERKKAVRSRVESIEIYERSSGQLPKRLCDDYFVYDLEIETNHNFFADGVLVHNCMVRRLKKDVLKELPPKTRKIVEIPANAEIRALLKQETEVYNEDEMDELETEAEFAKTSDNPEDYKKAVAALKLRTKAKFEGLSTIRRELAVAKARMPMVNELLEEALEDSEKLIIFCHHKEVVKALVDKFGSQAVVIVGDTPMHERQANRDRFQTDPSCKVIIGSFGAMGVGWTLTASSHVICFELDWVPGNVSQAEDRAHRIGQHDNVLVEHYVVEGSLDAVMAKRIIAKQNVIDQALDNITVREDADIPAPRGGTVVTFDKLAQEAALMTPKQRLAATLCIRQLAMMCNGARTHDGAGFNKLDTSIGRKLGFADTLSPKQCALARKISLKYVRQLQPDLVAQMQ